MKNGRISNKAINFTWEELTHSQTADTRGISNIPNEEVEKNLQRLAEVYLQPLRNEFGPLVINSAYRAKAVNAAVGGASNSRHLSGCAADIKVRSVLIACQMVTFLHQRFIKQGIGYDEAIISKHKGKYWLHLSYSPTGQNRLNTAAICY